MDTCWRGLFFTFKRDGNLYNFFIYYLRETLTVYLLAYLTLTLKGYNSFHLPRFVKYHLSLIA